MGFLFASSRGRRNESVDIAAIRFSTNAFLGHSEKEEEGVGRRQRFKGVISRWRVLAPPADDVDWIKWGSGYSEGSATLPDPKNA